MAVSLNNPNMTPPGLFRYRIPETGFFVKDHYAYNDLEESIVKHYKANHLPVPNDLRQRIMDQLCAQLPPNWCRDGTKGFVGFMRGLLHEFQRVLIGTTTLADWLIKAGGQRVNNEEVTRRGSICQRCPFNQPPIGCTACNIGALNKVVERAIGGHSLPIDAQLEACAVCGCSLKVKARIPMDVLKRHITEEQFRQFPPAHGGFPGCWLREEQEQNAI